jgi:hypothetical protein
MPRNFFLIAGRKIWRSKLYASLCILELSLGIVSIILIDLYLRYEKSFDEVSASPLCMFFIDNGINKREHSKKSYMPWCRSGENNFFCQSQVMYNVVHHY